MRPWRLFLLGVGLTLAGLFWIYTKIAWVVMVGHTCEGHWDADGCQRLLRDTYLSIVALGPGVSVLVVWARRLWIRCGAAAAPTHQPSRLCDGTYR